jgi:hypothetical protein
MKPFCAMLLSNRSFHPRVKIVILTAMNNN